jgi:hypothetical protein
MRFLLPLLAFVSVFAADAPAPLRVFLRCGPKTHGPGDHDHPAFARDWRPSPNAAGMKVSVVGDADEKGVQTFPSDEETRAHRGARHPPPRRGDFKPDERRAGREVRGPRRQLRGDPRRRRRRQQRLGRLLQGPRRRLLRHKVTKWREGPMQRKFVDKTHGITQGIADFGMKDEIYYDMDMGPDVHALATAPTPKKLGDGFEEQTQIWTYEKAWAPSAPSSSSPATPTLTSAAPT